MAPVANCDSTEYMTQLTVQLDGNNEINAEMMLNSSDVQAQ